jgi:hypothetical protein
MPRFGQYETDRLLYRAGFNAIYLCRPDRKASRPRIIKAYQPSGRVPAARDDTTPVDPFLDSAGVQEQVARAEAGYWAPVYESGVSPEGMFYVTDRYDLSAQQLIDGRVNLGAAGLGRLVESVARGLLALKRAGGRPHGNLKFSNILITRRGALAREKIVLSDPCPSSQLDEDTHARMDLQQVGTLIHQLVMHRNPPAVAGYQAPDSPEWHRLGRQGNAWRDLCNRLLAMEAGAEPMVLEELVARLPGVAQRGRNRVLKAAACLGLILLVAVLSGPAARLTINILRPPDPEEVKRAYQRCCEAQAWLGPLWSGLTEPAAGTDERRYDYWRQQGKILKTLVDSIRTFGETFETSGAGLDIPVNPPEKLATSRGYQRDVLAADRARGLVEAILSRDAAAWPLPKRLAERAAGLREAGCASLAGYMDTLVSSIPRRHEKLAESIDDVLYLEGNWYTVRYAELEPNAVRNDPNVTAPVQDAADFVARLHKLPGHYRQEISAFQDLLAAQRRVRDLLKEVIAGGDPDAEALEAQLESRLPPKIAQIRSTPFTKANERRLTEACRTAQNVIDEIEQQVKGPDKWFDEWRTEAARGISSSPAVNRAYVTRLDAWLGPSRDTFAARYQGRWGDLRLLRDKVSRTRDNLRRLDAGLPRTLVAEPASAAWAATICEYYASARRETLLAEITAGLALQEGFPEPNGYPPDCRRRMDWPERVLALIRDFTEIERGLDNCRQLEDKPVGARADLQSLYLDPNNRALLEEAPVRQALETIVTRVEEVVQIRDRVNGAEALLGVAGTTSGVEARYAAWRKLVSLPLVMQRWQEEEAVCRRLQTELGARRREGRLAETRWAELRQEIERTGEARERRFQDASIDQLAERVAVRAKDTGVAFLLQLGRFKPGAEADLSETRAFHACLRSLWDKNVGTADWPARYDLGQFDRARPEGALRTQAASAQTAAVAAWLSEMPQYRRIEDRRDTPRWQGTRQELGRSIDEGLSDMADDAEVTAQLAQAKTGLGELDGQFAAIKDLPAIEKYRTQVEKARDLWRQLQEMEDRVHTLVHPAYRHLTFRNGTARFKDGLRLDRFEPVDPRLAPFTRADLKDEFFQVVDRRDKQNAGWPKFIRARVDNTVILVFVPGDGQTPPFYLARGEITNAQYARFLLGARPKDFEALVKDTLYKTTHPYPSALNAENYDRIDPNRVDHPVVWVTYEGANEYAHWLSSSARLPQASWFRRAVEYTHPATARYVDPSLYHLRSTAWAKAVREYNERCRSAGDILSSVAGKTPAPLGAVHEFGSFKLGQLLPDPVVQLEPGIYPSAWPMPSHPVPALVISDLLGNVWEWCEDARGAPVLCGGSCLSPPEDIGPAVVGTPPRRGAECDLGFRVALPCP